MEPLANFFDLKFEQLLVRYQSPRNKNWRDHFGYETESESNLTLGRPGVILLLGKNGSGKTRFLNGLQVFGEKKLEFAPSISLRYSVPPLDQHLGYLDAKENLMQTVEYQESRASQETEVHSVEAFDKYFINLPFHDLIIRSIVHPILNFSFRNKFDFELGEEVLKFFEFSESEINAFKKRMSAHLFENAGSPQALDFFDLPRENLNFRDYFAEFFLALLAKSLVFKGDYEPGPGSFFHHEEYLSDLDNRVNLVSGLRDLFEGTTHVELKIADGNLCFSLVNKDKYGDGLRELQLTLSELRKKYDIISFPFDILRNQLSPSSNWLKIEEDLNFNWEPFSVHNLTFQRREDSVADLEKIFLSFVNIKINFGKGTSYDIAVSGLDDLTHLLEQVNTLLPQVEIGISKVELHNSNPDPVPVPAPLVFVGPKTGHDFGPTIWVRDSSSKNWLTLNECSDGQLDVIRILINICNYSKQYSYAQTKFLLIDEFDRHLHPVVAQQLLSLLDRYAKKYGSYVILSTHSFGSLEIHKHMHLFASRDLRGFQQLSTNQQEDSKLLAFQLGVPEIDTRKLKKLLVVVEGIHEEIIFNELLLNDIITADIEIIRGDGLYGLANFWRSQLQYESADVLIVYDKRNNQLEEEWQNIKLKNSGAKLVENLWNKHPQIDQMLTECLRCRDERIPGHTELRTLAFMLKEILKPNENQIKSIRRLHLHGVEVPDIVDCLPISEFPRANNFDSWVELREANPGLYPDRLKKEFGITADSVTKAVKNSKDWTHPELQRLYNRILGIVDLPSDWPTK